MGGHAGRAGQGMTWQGGKARRCALLVRSSGGNQSRLVGCIYLSLHNSKPSSEYYRNVTCVLVRKIKTVK